MNKKNKIIFLLLFLITLLFSNIYIVNAAFADDINNQVNDIQNNVSNLQKTTYELRNQYLQQEWTKVVSQNKYIGPIHNLFVANPLIFKLLFNEPYSFSLTFFIIFILWIFIFVLVKKITKSFFRSNWKSWIFGIAIAMAIAWSTAIKGIAMLIIQLTFSEKAWWLRTLMWLVVFIVVMVIYYLDNALAKNIKASIEAKEKAELKQKTEENSAFIRGAKRGLDSDSD